MSLTPFRKNSVPPRTSPSRLKNNRAKGDLVLNGVTVHLLDGVHQAISATGIREAVAAGKSLGRFVDPAVADYIKKMDLYRNGR